MPTKAELITAIDGMANYLNQVSQWYVIGAEPFGQIEADTEVSYVFEFYCYIRFVNELSIVGNRITFYNNGFMGNLFPKGPAEKNQGWAKFEIRDHHDQIIYDVCAGVMIHTGIPNYTYAADISIQDPVQIPHAHNTFLIVDAKFKTNPNHQIPIRQLREFKAVLIDLGFPKGNPNATLLGTSFAISSIVTNGQTNAYHIQYSTVNGFNQIGNFHP